MTRVSTVGTFERKWSRGAQQDGSEGLTGRTLVEELHLASAMDKDVVREHARTRGPSLRDIWGASSSPAQTSEDAGISA